MPPDPAAPLAPVRSLPGRTPAPRTPTTIARVRVHEAGGVIERPDRLVTEEPLEIRVQDPAGDPTPIVVTMRTPGHDFELTAGFLHSEGLLAAADAVESIAYCLAGDGAQEYNIVTARLRVPVELDAHRRYFTAHSSCGVCGKTTLDQLELVCPPVASGLRVSDSVLVQLPDRLRGAQTVFNATGGLHAAARFDASGALIELREDVGRHNAVDKLIGRSLLDQCLPLDDSMLIVSGRVSFEIVQKAAMAGFPLLGGVSAPSSLAVATAARLGQTLVGFLRADRFVVYTGAERIESSP